MATSKGKILKEQITFDFFETMEIYRPIKQKKTKVVNIEKSKEVKKPTQIIFRKAKNNIKPNHRKLNIKVRRIF